MGVAFPGAFTAAELFEREAAARKVITFCGNLDDILGGGVSSSQITEFCEFVFIFMSVTLCEHPAPKFASQCCSRLSAELPNMQVACLRLERLSWGMQHFLYRLPTSAYVSRLTGTYSV